MILPGSVRQLVARYGQARQAGLAPTLPLEQDFVEPLFDALGWTRDGGRVRRSPSVAFTFDLRGIQRFCAEAVSPSGHGLIPHPAEIRVWRYAWSRRMPVAILTDFERLRVLDTRSQPEAACSRAIAEWSWDDYSRAWPEIAALLGREAVANGSLERRLPRLPKRRVIDVGDALLRDVAGWRDLFPRSAAATADHGVRQALDRILFLRICEARALSPAGELSRILAAPRPLEELVRWVPTAEQAAGEFPIGREGTSALDRIQQDLYAADSPYDFSAVPDDVLGHVYEQLLGVNDTGPNSTAGAARRKSGGVFYTPEYVVDFIIRRTLGPVLASVEAAVASPVRVLDPACGSGSFLLGAYKYLLEWHLQQYLAETAPQPSHPAVERDAHGQWTLTLAERRRILLDHIYGVDVDAAAVEVSRLALLLRLLDVPEGVSLPGSLREFCHDTARALEANLQVGNSLVDDSAELEGLSRAGLCGMQPFRWRDRFPQVFTGADAGFDVVTGNPPYIRVRQLLEQAPAEAAYYRERYRSACGAWDVSLLFYERALELCRAGGHFGFVVPIQLLHQPNAKALRVILTAEATVTDVADLARMRVFQDAEVKNCIVLCRKCEAGDALVNTYEPASAADLADGVAGVWPHSAIRRNPGLSLKPAMLSPRRDLCERLIGRSWRLEELCYVTFGLRSCAKGKGQGGKDRLITDDADAPMARPYLEGREIARFAPAEHRRYIRYIPTEMYSPRTPELFEPRKIVSRSMLSDTRIVATLDEGGRYVEQSLVCVVPHQRRSMDASIPDLPLEFILAAMNSSVQQFFFGTYVIDHSLGGGLIHATPGSQAKLLIPRTGPGEIEAICAGTRALMELNSERQSAAPGQSDSLQVRIREAERRLDQMVSEAFGLDEQAAEMAAAALGG